MKLGIKILFLIVFLGLSVFADAFLFSIHRSNAYIAKHYQQTTGHITHSAVRSGYRGRTYTVDIAYEYSVGERTYLGSRISAFAASSSNKTVWERLADRYPVGSTVEVHYDPTDPQQSVLNPISPYPPLFMITGIVLIHLAAMLIAFAICKAMRESKNLPNNS